MFGDNSEGFTNEIKIINYINSCRSFDLLNQNFKNFLSFLFDANLTRFSISAYKPKGQVKPDIGITINGITKFVSVKKGSGNSVHQEPLTVFESFLVAASVPPNSITYLKEFHYGDGSTNGNGGPRINATTWQANNPQKVFQMNRDFNNPYLLQALFNKFLFIGNIPDAPIVDVIYHGTINEGLWASRSEVISYLLSVNNTATNVHFSKLTYQVWNRNLNYNPNTSSRRHVMQVKWPSLTNDLLYIQRHRN
ncbi:hypothetical protein EDC18_103206 [Natranaerovirga pectinivora]|uniref:Uncharacterized protein n=1 Tax=Natranaerovirga pectinivora TaxID=682400 RepID=A0A4R3MQQ2_9FIRM|nr:hypothetical protein [Natranaerovirga pectinivora]TCT15501.1 hypothetical protein EDC18_103206 [Natranaerovirga pectinivora]